MLTVADPRAANRDGADIGLYPALRQITGTDQATASDIVDEIGMRADEGFDLRLDGLRQRRMPRSAQINECRLLATSGHRGRWSKPNQGHLYEYTP